MEKEFSEDFQQAAEDLDQDLAEAQEGMVLFDPYEAQLDSIPGSGEGHGGLPLVDETSSPCDATEQSSTFCKEDAAAEEETLAETLLWTACTCRLCVQFFRSFKACAACFKRMRTHRADCPYKAQKIRYVNKYYSSKLALYLKMIAHGEAEDVDMAVEHVKKEAQTESAKEWGQKKDQAEKAQQRAAKWQARLEQAATHVPAPSPPLRLVPATQLVGRQMVQSVQSVNVAELKRQLKKEVLSELRQESVKREPRMKTEPKQEVKQELTDSARKRRRAAPSAALASQIPFLRLLQLLSAPKCPRARQLTGARAGPPSPPLKNNATSTAFSPARARKT